MSIFHCGICEAQKDADFVGCYSYEGKEACGDCMEDIPANHCFECDRTETDPACLDTETCGCCGCFLEAFCDE